MITSTLVDCPDGHNCVLEYDSLADAIRSQLIACDEAPDNRSPVVFHRGRKCVATLVPQDGDMTLVYANGRTVRLPTSGAYTEEQDEKLA